MRLPSPPPLPQARLCGRSRRGCGERPFLSALRLLSIPPSTSQTCSWLLSRKYRLPIPRAVRETDDVELGSCGVSVSQGRNLHAHVLSPGQTIHAHVLSIGRTPHALVLSIGQTIHALVLSIGRPPHALVLSIGRTLHAPVLSIGRFQFRRWPEQSEPQSLLMFRLVAQNIGNAVLRWLSQALS